MAYVRWSSPGEPHPYDSAIYVMDHVDGDLECVNCKRTPDHGPVDSFRCWTPEEMAEHVQWHIYSGDAVPEFVIPSLLGVVPRWPDATLAEMIPAARAAGARIATSDADVPAELRMTMEELAAAVRELQEIELQEMIKEERGA